MRWNFSFQIWYAKTPLGKKRAKAAKEGEEDVGGKGKGKPKGGKKGGKKKKWGTCYCIVFCQSIFLNLSKVLFDCS